MKKIVILLIVVALIGIGYIAFTKKEHSSGTATSSEYTSAVYTFRSKDGQFTVQYDAGGTKAELVYSGKQYELNSVESASGAKYESTDGSVLFWEHQGEGLFEIDGKPVFEETARWVCDPTQGDCPQTEGDTSSDTGTQATSGENVPVSLVGSVWLWKNTTDASGKVVATPKDANAFTFTFVEDGRFSATTDCNNLMGEFSPKLSDGFVVNSHTLPFDLDKIASTKKACPDMTTQEGEFSEMLEKVNGISISHEGQTTLTLTLPDDGAMIFTSLPPEVMHTYDAIVGMSEADAMTYAQEKGVPFRVVTRDGESQAVTADYRPGRINAEIANGNVTGYSVER